MSNENVNNSGKIKSTSEPDKVIEPLFDYGDITERDKSVVGEVIEFLKTRDGVPSAMLIEELKIKFQIVEIPMMDLKTSVWYNLTKDERIGFSMQGHRETTDKDGNKIRIPHIGFSADLDYLDEMAQRLTKKILTLTNTQNKKEDK